MLESMSISSAGASQRKTVRLIQKQRAVPGSFAPYALDCPQILGQNASLGRCLELQRRNEPHFHHVPYCACWSKMSTQNVFPLT